jgi:hypothetical protein
MRPAPSVWSCGDLAFSHFCQSACYREATAPRVCPTPHLGQNNLWNADKVASINTCWWAGEPQDLACDNIKHLAGRIRRGNWSSATVPDPVPRLLCSTLPGPSLKRMERSEVSYRLLARKRQRDRRCKRTELTNSPISTPTRGGRKPSLFTRQQVVTIRLSSYYCFIGTPDQLPDRHIWLSIVKASTLAAPALRLFCSTPNRFFFLNKIFHPIGVDFAED